MVEVLRAPPGSRTAPGFYYGRFDAPKAGDELQAVNQNQRIYFHKIGTPQTADTLVYERPDHPTWGFSPVVTDDGRYLLVYQSEGHGEQEPGVRPGSGDAGLDAAAVPRRVRRLLHRRRQRRPDLLRGDRSRRAARQAGGDRPGRAAAGGVEAAGRRGAQPRRARRGHHARRSLRRHLADRRAARAARLRPARRARARDRAADARLGRLLLASARSRRVLLVHVVHVSVVGLSLRSGRRRQRAVPDAEAGLHAVGLRDHAGLLHVEGRHEDPDVHHRPQGRRARRARRRRSSTATAASTSR